MKCPKCETENPAESKFCNECATSLMAPDVHTSFTKTLETPVESLTRGTLFANRYEIIEKLGEGGMGSVYRVEDTKAREEITLKLIRSEIAADKKTIERFRNELTTARKIRHKNVCGMYDLGEHEGTHYITMEYVSGEDLKSLVRRVTFDTGTAIKIAKQVCEGLAEAHRLGVVHRDLKPSNIMIDKEGNARIMDFGIARSLSAKGLTGEGIIIGTPEYMSPEQAEAKEIDQRSDIYSFGVILYEIVTGQLPFTGDTPLSIAMKHKGENPKDPKELNPQLPDDLRAVILKCLEKEREQRYQTQDDLRAELEKTEQSLPTTDRVVTGKKPITSREITVQLNVRKLFIPVLAVIVLIIIGLFLWRPWSRTKPVPVSGDRPSLAVLYYENNSGNHGLDYFKDVILNSLITDLNQSKYLSVVSQDQIFSVLRNLKLDDAVKYSSEDLKAISEACGVRNIVTGSFYAPGDKFIFNTSFKNLLTEETSGFSEEAENETDIPDIIDMISLRIKSMLGLSQEEILRDTDEKIGRIRSYSPDALKYFAQGNKYYTSGEYDKAIPLLEAAVEADPDMAIAYAHLGTIYWNKQGTESPNVLENMEKALSLSDRVSERERLLIQGTYFATAKEDYEKAIKVFEELVEKYPDEFLAYRRLGLNYRTIGEEDKGREFYEKAYKIRPDSFMEVNNLIGMMNNAREFEKTEKVLLSFLEKYPENPSALRRLVDAYRNQDKYDLALSALDRLFQIAPDQYTYPSIRAWIYVRKGDLTSAENEMKKMFESDIAQEKYTGIKDLSRLRLYQGRMKEALELIKQTVKWYIETDDDVQIRIARTDLTDLYLADENPVSALKECELVLQTTNVKNWAFWKRQIICRKGICLAALKNFSNAMAAAEELRQINETKSPVSWQRLYPFLMGKIEYAKRNYKKANEYLGSAVKMMEKSPGEGLDISPYEYIYSLAESYYQSGNLEKAKAEFEKIQSLFYDFNRRLDRIGLSSYMLGKINEQQGNEGRAIENYEKFLGLWKDADPSLPEVADARERMVALKNNQD